MLNNPVRQFKLVSSETPSNTSPIEPVAFFGEDGSPTPPVTSLDISSIVKLSEAEYAALPTPRDPKILYLTEDV